MLRRLYICVLRQSRDPGNIIKVLKRVRSHGFFTFINTRLNLKFSSRALRFFQLNRPANLYGLFIDTFWPWCKWKEAVERNLRVRFLIKDDKVGLLEQTLPSSYRPIYFIFQWKFQYPGTFCKPHPNPHTTLQTFFSVNNMTSTCATLVSHGG